MTLALTPPEPEASASADVQRATTCRVCGERNLLPYFDLGQQPLANAFRDPFDHTPEFTAPLAVQACLTCKLSQLTHVVTPARLYSDYVYYSGANHAWQAHCEALAADFGQLDGKLVLEIGSNDGTLLKCFERLGAVILGVEPAQNFASCGYPVVSECWSSHIAERPWISNSVHVLLATNVLGHVDDAHDFMRGISLALADDGVAIIEVPTILQLLKRNAFDTIYHEHLSYWSVTALERLCAEHGLVLQHTHSINVHGGSMRFRIGRQGTPSSAVLTWLQREQHHLRPKHYSMFAGRCKDLIEEIASQLPLCDAGYGAAAKTTVLFNALPRRSLPLVVYDDSPHKQDKVIPGTLIQVLAPYDFSRFDTLAILAWNWADTLMVRAYTLGFKGSFFIPLPKPQWLR